MSRSLAGVGNESGPRRRGRADRPGVPDSEVEVLERSRETALRHSSGMGLWLVNWVVEKSGGELEFERDDGTRAVVRLPTP